MENLARYNRSQKPRERAAVYNVYLVTTKFAKVVLCVQCAVGLCTCQHERVDIWTIKV